MNYLYIGVYIWSLALTKNLIYRMIVEIGISASSSNNEVAVWLVTAFTLDTAMAYVNKNILTIVWYNVCRHVHSYDAQILPTLIVLKINDRKCYSWWQKREMVWSREIQVANTFCCCYCCKNGQTNKLKPLRLYFFVAYLAFQWVRHVFSNFLIASKMLVMMTMMTIKQIQFVHITSVIMVKLAVW